MHIGILGTGIVGQTLGLRLVQLGHPVMLGTRDPSQLDEPKGRGPDARTLRATRGPGGADPPVPHQRNRVDARGTGDASPLSRCH